MTLPSFATQEITVLRAPSITDHGSAVPDWGSAEAHSVAGCSVQPTAGQVDQINRRAVTTVYTVYAPTDADVLDTDRIQIGGRAFDIDGSVERWETGVLDHLLIPLKYVEG